MVDPDNQGFACLGSLPSHWPSVFLCPFWRPGVRICGFGAGWWAAWSCAGSVGRGGKPAPSRRRAFITQNGLRWSAEPGLEGSALAPGNPAGRTSPSLAGQPASGAQPPPSGALLYPRLLPPCSLWPPWAQPIRRERSQQAPANPRPVFAGTAKPLGEKQ